MTVGLLGGDIQSAADSLAACGAASILAVSGADFASSRYATDAAAVEALVQAAAPTVILAPATSRFSRCLPGVAHRCDGRIDTHVTGIEAVDGTVKCNAGIIGNAWWPRSREHNVPGSW